MAITYDEWGVEFGAAGDACTDLVGIFKSGVWHGQGTDGALMLVDGDSNAVLTVTEGSYPSPFPFYFGAIKITKPKFATGASGKLRLFY